MVKSWIDAVRAQTAELGEYECTHKGLLACLADDVHGGLVYFGLALRSGARLGSVPLPLLRGLSTLEI